MTNWAQPSIQLPAVMPRDEHLKSLRAAELQTLRRFFAPRARVLEIGGGNGWQAKLISEWGCDVTSVDVDPTGNWENTYFQVSKYDGTHLPFPDVAFDVVFSSNVLEHVANLHDLLVESIRVLKPTGIAIHVMPTPTWRLWTSLTHYLHLLKRGSSLMFHRGSRHARDRATKAAGEKAPRRYRKVIFAESHGTSPSAWQELFEFSRKRWLHKLTSAGYDVIAAFPGGIFYSGYGISPLMRISTRRALARIVGSSCNVFVMRRGNR